MQAFKAFRFGRLAHRAKLIKYDVLLYLVENGPGRTELELAQAIHGPKERNSYPIQACDTVAYFLLQRFRPNSFIRKRGGQFLFDRLDPVLNKHASPRNPLGIVRL